MSVFLVIAFFLSANTFGLIDIQERRKITDQLEGKYQGFTMANPESLIIELEEPIRVRSVRGRVVRFLDHIPLEDVLIEVRGPGGDLVFRSTRTDRKGNFHIRGTREGEYRFKATMDGWRSIVGVIVVNRKTNRNSRVELVMQLGT